MTKALLKKQMMEVFSWVYQNKKSGKNRSKGGIVLYALLYLLVFGFLGFSFYMVAAALCQPLVSAGFGWLYFAIMGLLSVAFGVFGSVFSTYTSLYQAKDNDLLLSMPVPASKILMIRLSGVYTMGLMYELIIMIPTVIAYFLAAPVNAAGIVCTLLIPWVLSVFVLILSAVLGWVVALVGSRLKNKNIVVVFLSLAFITGYYYLYSQAYSILERILSNPETIAAQAKTFLYPLYHMGLAAQGNLVSMVIFTAIAAVLFGIVYLLLSRSFLKLATTNRGAPKVRYRERKTAARTAGQALLGKELRRFLGSASYMLNCGLGIVLMIVGAVALIIKGDVVVSTLTMVFAGYEDMIPLIAVAAVCLFTTMNDITAPSVSLEGKNIWLVQSLPVSARQVLMAKLKLHLLLTLIPAAVLTAAVEWVIRPAPVFALLIFLSVGAFILFMAAFGLFLNLLMPNLTWTSETVPIKQSMAVMIALFGGWAIIMLFGVAYYLLSGVLSPLAYLLCATVILSGAFLVLLRWIKTRGERIFESL